MFFPFTYGVLGCSEYIYYDALLLKLMMMMTMMTIDANNAFIIIEIGGDKDIMLSNSHPHQQVKQKSVVCWTKKKNNFIISIVIIGASNPFS